MLAKAAERHPSRGVRGGALGLGKDRRREHPVGQVVEPSVALAARYEQPAVEKKLLEGRLGKGRRAPHPPALSAVVERLGADRARARDRLHDELREFPLPRGEAAHPRARPGRARAHRRVEVGPRLEGERDEDVRGRQVVLERGALGGGEPAPALLPVKVPHEAALPVPGDAVPKDVVVHPAADVDRVDLHVAVVREHRSDVGGRGIDEVRPPQEKAGLQLRDLSRARHGLAGRVGTARGGGPASGAAIAGGRSALITCA